MTEFWACKFCSCVFCTESDLSKHLKAFGVNKRLHKELLERAHREYWSQ